MESPNAATWDVSRGIIFAGEGRVVYPRLPLARYHSDSAPVLGGDDGSSSMLAGKLPTRSSGDAHAAGSGQEPEPEPKGEEALAADGTATNEEPPSKAPFTPLSFKIPDDVFRAAKTAAEGSPESFWSYAMYRGPSEDDTPGPKVKVHYCTSKHTTERVLQNYFMNEKVLGFDLEWASDATKGQGPRRNVSLVQLASPSRVALFHLALYPKGDEMVAPSFKKLMEDPEITKTGVWIKGDCTRLRTYLDINARGIFELSHLYRLVKYSTTGEHKLVNKQLVSLAVQVMETLQLPLFKGGGVRTSDWSRPLGMEQIIYSASDAYAAVHLYAMLNHERELLDPTPPLPHHAELNLPIRLADQVILPATDEQEPVEEPKDEPIDAGTVDFTKYLNSIGVSYTVNVEAEGDDEQTAVAKETASLTVTATSTTTTTTTSVQKPTPKPSTAVVRPPDPRFTEADLWARQRCAGASTSKARAPAYILRAFYLWHKNEDLGPEGVAALLRDPPLQTMTVVNYISEAVRLEHLTFDKRRLREEVLAKVPKESLTVWRYKPLVAACREED